MPPSRHGRQRGYHIVFSSGVYFLTREDANLKAAVDRAHYAKDLSKGSYSSMVTVYSEQIKQVIADEKEIEGMMGDALKNGEFQPYFQAKVDVVTRKIVGAEALTRWIHPEKGSYRQENLSRFSKRTASSSGLTAIFLRKSAA